MLSRQAEVWISDLGVMWSDCGRYKWREDHLFAALVNLVGRILDYSSYLFWLISSIVFVDVCLLVYWNLIVSGMAPSHLDTVRSRRNHPLRILMQAFRKRMGGLIKVFSRHIKEVSLILSIAIQQRIRC